MAADTLTPVHLLITSHKVDMNTAYNYNKIRDCRIIGVVAADTLTPVPLLLTSHKVDMNAAYNYNKIRDCRIIRVVAADTLTPGIQLQQNNNYNKFVLSGFP